MEAREWVLLFGAVATILSAYVAARVGGRSSVEVAQVSARVDERRTATEEFTAVTAELRAALRRSDEQVAALTSELGELREELAAATRQREHEREQDRAVRMQHAAWDWTTYNQAREHGLNVSPPPPLLAPPPV